MRIGEIAVALDALAEDEDVRGAVHGFEGHQVRLAGQDRAFVLAARDFIGDDEHVFAVLAPVAGLLPLARVHQLGGLHFLVGGGVEAAAQIGFERAPQHEALGVPEHAALRFGLEVEEVHLLADAAVIALGGFLEADQVGVELLLVEPARAVDAAEHRVRLVAAPVCAGHAGQFEGLRV